MKGERPFTVKSYITPLLLGTPSPMLLVPPQPLSSLPARGEGCEGLSERAALAARPVGRLGLDAASSHWPGVEAGALLQSEGAALET